MQIAILSESQADETAVRTFVDGLLGQTAQWIDPPPIRTRGWPQVLNILPTVLKHLHYQTTADALVVVVDANHSPLHSTSHDQPGNADHRCRLCQLRTSALHTRNHLRPVPDRQPIKTAIGVAVPSIEAWYCCGINPQVSEAAWLQHLQADSYRHIKNHLKQQVYGTERPSLALETQRASEEAQRLVQDLSVLEGLFPNGFAPLARDVRSWLAI